MKNLNTIIIAIILITNFTLTAQVAINTDGSNADPSAMLDVKATGLGLLAPRMAILDRPLNPATGLLIYQTDSNPGYYYFDGVYWQKIVGSFEENWFQNGSDIFNTNPGNIYIGTNSSDGHRLNVMNFSYGGSAVRGIEQDGPDMYSEGMLGLLNYAGNPHGLPVNVANIGVYGHKPNAGFEGAAVYGWNNDDNWKNYSGLFVADGSSTYTNYALYADADNAATNYAGYFKGRVEVYGNSGSDNAADSSSTVLYAEATHSGPHNTYAIHGKSYNEQGYGIGVYGEGGYKGVVGVSNNPTSLTTFGVYGFAGSAGGTRIGVYGQAFGGTDNWAGYFSGDVYVSSDMRIGTTTQATGYALSVDGKIACEEILVDDDGSWPDYVFDDSYDLMSLEDVEQSINENNHLPGLPSAKEVEENGFELAAMQKLVLEKVEELTLYTINQDKMIDRLNNKIETLEKENRKLNDAIKKRK